MLCASSPFPPDQTKFPELPEPLEPLELPELPELLEPEDELEEELDGKNSWKLRLFLFPYFWS